MSISKKDCPVPFDQQPLNEYLSLKESKFFAWSTKETKEYFTTVIYLLIILLICLYPLIYSLLSIKKFFIKSIILDIMLVNSILLLIFLRLYLGWSYVIKRLLSATIFYEESGWYDGQIWVKTANSLMQDRLIGLYEVIPFIQRIKFCILYFIILLIINFIIYHLI
uniref:Hypothetical chloroplast RF36 n=1 Tax=Campylaephora sungminbooi TaxID=1896769 RepID=A0A1B0TI95_9FLOR|nr:hypothetical chloroplast RF36 [Campylaephora sungminbooi]AKU47439.1 hypothetical chloroplast RF36 [Campylaephora sungminbooi]ALN11886.1 hypothetical chloroplast RF36 [Campylaephora sungminbooi]